MSDFMPDISRAPSPQASADLKALVRDHGISGELINSLITSKEEARAHIRFFKRMMFMTNGLVMTIGLVLAGFGLRQIKDGFSPLGIFCLIVGSLLFLAFARVFMKMSRAILATEAAARKHELI